MTARGSKRSRGSKAASAEATEPFAAPNEPAAVDAHGMAAGLPEWTRPIIDQLPIDELAAKMVGGALNALFVEHLADRAFAAAYHDATRENLRTFRQYILGRLELDAFSPTHATALASMEAQLEIRESAIHDAYRIGATTVLDHWSREVTRLAAALDIDDGEVIETIREFTTALFLYQARQLSSVATAHAEAQETLRASRVAERRRIIHEILAGECSLLPAEISAVLDYHVGFHHLVIVLPECGERRAAELVGSPEVAEIAAGTLTLPLGAASTAVWLGRDTDWTDRARRQVRELLQYGEYRAALSRPSPGIEGFVEAFQEARRADTVRQSLGSSLPDVLTFDDIALEALAIGDPDAARELVAGELGELGALTQTGEELRATVLVWFATGSHVSAAASLGLHEHTVRNRLRRAEELIGHPLTTRRIELQVALRLHPVLFTDAASPRSHGRSRNSR